LRVEVRDSREPRVRVVRHIPAVTVRFVSLGKRHALPSWVLCEQNLRLLPHAIVIIGRADGMTALTKGINNDDASC
jgi:hypothetical protein